MVDTTVAKTHLPAADLLRIPHIARLPTAHHTKK